MHKKPMYPVVVALIIAAVPALARAELPHVGDVYKYRYSSAWQQIPARTLVVRVVAASPQGVQDAVSLESSPQLEDVRTFGPRLEEVTRPLGSGFAALEFSPYLDALGALTVGMSRRDVVMPTDVWAFLPWNVRMRAEGNERVTVPAGTFETIRVSVYASRSAYQVDDAIDPVRWSQVLWYAPAVNRVVRHVRRTEAALGQPLDQDMYELIDYRQAMR